MKKIIYLIIGGIIFSLLSIIAIKSYTSKIPAYQLSKEIKEKFTTVYKMDQIDFGPECSINIYLTNEDIEFNEIEIIFEEFLERIYDKEVYQYFVDYHEKKVLGELAKMSVCFRKKGNQEEVIYKFSTIGEEGQSPIAMWRIVLDDEREIIYILEDYK
jgi:hypothetical protein